jgi:hypothetical protein
VRSPLELLGGRFEHALLTTYSFNLRFFEEWVLRALWAAEVRNIVVFVDPHQLGHALEDRAPSAAGRAYHVVAATTAKAAFHPKVLLVTGANGARLCVSSANLTPDGQLRNAESLIAFDSQLSGHLRPILDAADLFRRLSADAPPHTAAAIQAALATLPDDDGASSGYQLVHNLDRALLETFPPSGTCRAIAPFVDADGSAAARLHERCELTVIVDAENVAASEAFFAGPWTVEARAFEARLHGKAYEVTTPDGRWVLIGSPNLSTPALLEPARAGNLEVAVAVTIEEPLELPPSTPADSSEGLAQHAAARLAAARNPIDDQRAAGRAFDAWEDERRIVVSGLPDGTRIERWMDERWHPFGTVTDGAVLVADPNVRPTRIRAVLADGSLAFAIVAIPARLRARMKASTSGRQTEAAERLPLDVETVRVLEEALSHLYALSELAGEAPRGPRPTAWPTPSSGGQQHGLLEWMPRNPDEEPRVPTLYAKHWKGEPDALLALISRVLRLDTGDSSGGEDDVGREQVDLEDLENVTSVDQIKVEESPAEAPRPTVDPKELDRYRQAFKRLFARGLEFMSSTADGTLAGWTFTYLLRLVEDLGTHHVDIHGHTELLMQREPLRAITLDLLETYLHRGIRDPLCLATARVHLAASVRQRNRYSVRDAERLDALCFAWASELIELPADLPGPAPEALDLDIAGVISWLEDYAERSNWSAIEKEAAAQLGPGWLERHPWPMIVGSASFPNRLKSPAWELLAFAAPAGFDSKAPFGVIVHNADDAPVATHAIVCDPRSHLIVEAWERSSDHVWHERRYGFVSRGTVERLRGPFALADAEEVVTHADLDTLREPLNSLAPLLRDAAFTFD